METLLSYIMSILSSLLPQRNNCFNCHFQMLRRPESPLLDAHLIKKHRPSSSCPRCLSCLAIAVLSLHFLFLHSTHRTDSGNRGLSCDSGLVYVYDLPPRFNKDLIDDCHNLTPWHSLCDVLSNSGFGPISANLAGVIPDNLLPFWHDTNQFAAELIFHRRILSHHCRTTNPSAAAAFYVPFYAGLAVGKHLWSPNSTPELRDRDCVALLQWLGQQDAWKQTGGKDYFMVLGRITWDFRRSITSDWGSSFLYMREMRHVTRLLLERSPWDERDVGLPYPTGFHPRTAAQVQQWQSFLLRRNRSTLFSFAGAARARFNDDFRALLIAECEGAREECRSVECEASGRCGDRRAGAVGLFLDSVFCLQPRGDSYTRRSMFDCMVAGAVPVLFWRRSAYEQYGWYLPVGEEEGEWSVFVDSRRVRRGVVSVREVLEGIGEERVRRMRERVVEMVPRLLYSAEGEGFGEGVKDAVDVAVDGVLRRFEERRRKERRRREEEGGAFSWFRSG